MAYASTHCTRALAVRSRHPSYRSTVGLRLVLCFAFNCGTLGLIANSGNLDAPVFGLVLAIERNDYAREPFDDVRVSRGPAIESPRADATNDFHYFLFCLGIVTANQHIP